jgi:aspartyl-tRNA(Asn)/glutamyl-tRNA(Gln) amidotransferase subunit A
MTDAREALERIRRVDGRLHAFVRTFDPPLGTGPLTFAVKDLFDIEGVPTGGGGRHPLDPAPKSTARAVQRLLDEGWACVGKTHTVELAYGGWGTNRALGAPWNPRDAAVHRCPGGSSSGSAVAVAAGLCNYALGTDTGGSVRIPAACCGCVGLKPASGFVSLQGVHPLAPSLDTVGVLGRPAWGAAQMLEIIGEGRPFDLDAALAADIRGWRLAAAPLDELGEVQPDVARLYLQAQDLLRDAGAEVVEARAPRPLEHYFSRNGLIMGAEGWRVRAGHIARYEADMDPFIVERFKAGALTSDEALASALETRASDQAEFHDWLIQFQGMILPTCPITAPPLDQVDERTYPLSRLTRGINYLDLPAATVPCGLGDDGMPVGLQLVGRPRDETKMAALAIAFQSLSPWPGLPADLSGFD